MNKNTVPDYRLNDDKADAEAERDAEVERQVASAWEEYMHTGHLPYGGGDVSLIDEEAGPITALDRLLDCLCDQELLDEAHRIADIRRRIIDKHIRRLVEANV